ncbi:MAG: amino acid ABC transporter permease [Actinomycetota bacterium]
MSSVAETGEEQPHINAGLEPLNAVPVRHPGRWLAIAVIAVLVSMLAHLLITNPAFEWSVVVEAMYQRPVIEGLIKGTLVVTVASMALGVSAGVLLAVMRLSANPILSGSAWVFTWFFRGVPRLVLLTVMGALGILFRDGIAFGIPFDTQLIGWLGLDGDWRFFTADANTVFGGLVGGIIGLGLSEAAYMAEIARAGILSVDRGQNEAAQALGMTNAQAMRRIVLPQAMRVIVPPTGNETIAMLKDTSLLIGLPVTTELFFQLQSIGSRTFKTFPLLVTATTFYLALTSVLMVGQYFLERRFGRGFGVTSKPRPRATESAGKKS